MNPTNRAIHPAETPALASRVAEKVAAVRATLKAAADEFGDSLTFANSLGAEDVLLTDIIAGTGLPIEIFLLDTGRLPDETYALLATLEQRYERRLRLYFPDTRQVEQFIATSGINAFYDSVALRRECCRVRKIEPLARALAGKKAWITGLRAAQSVSREHLAAREFDAAHQLVKLNPLADWAETEVWFYIQTHKLPYNALHERFYPSIGCAPCTRAITPGEDVRAGRWWWESSEGKECGLHPNSIK